jgi:hypothetical protein
MHVYKKGRKAVLFLFEAIRKDNILRLDGKRQFQAPRSEQIRHACAVQGASAF